MSETEKWQDENTRYLSEAIAQLRQTLERYAQRHQHTGSSPIIPEVVPPTFLQRLMGKTSSSTPTVRALLTPPASETEKTPTSTIPIGDNNTKKAHLNPPFTILT